MDDVPFVLLRLLGMGNVRRVIVRRQISRHSQGRGAGPVAIRGNDDPGKRNRIEPDTVILLPYHSA